MYIINLCFVQMVCMSFCHHFPGRPVAVTSNRGGGKVSYRDGSNPQLEMEYYQNRILNNKTDKGMVF